jgi:uncharacterized BrkB/YihY/UPF0761 family membrane protein
VDAGAPDLGPDLPTPPVVTGKVGRAKAWAKDTAQRGSTWALGARKDHASVDVGFRLADRDKRVAAGVLAGGVAYRFFFWLLSCFVLLTGGLGLGTGPRVEAAVSSSGLDPQVAQVVLDSWSSTQGSHWWVLLVGLWLVLWTGYLVAKALVLVHAAVWGVAPPPLRNPLRASLMFSATALAFCGCIALARWLRAESPRLGLVATLLVVAVPFAVSMLAARALPHGDVGWLGLLPGAVLFALGVQGLHLFTVYYLVPKLGHSTELYGILGIVGTLLLWLYISGRLVVAAATLNASLYEQRSGQAPSERRPFS